MPFKPLIYEVLVLFSLVRTLLERERVKVRERERVCTGEREGKCLCGPLTPTP